MGFLGVRFEVEGGKLPSCLKLFKIMLETCNLACKYTYTYLVLENIPFRTKAFLILLMSAIFVKYQRFLAEIVHLRKAVE